MRNASFFSLATLAVACIFIVAHANPPETRTREGDVKMIHRYLLNFSKGETTKSQGLPNHNVTKRLVIVSPAVEANGISNSTAPNGAYVVSLEDAMVTVRVEKDNTEIHRQVGVQVIDYN